MKPKISVVVLNWNEKKLTEKCIHSLIAQTIELNIVIVDNGSKDDSVEYLENKFTDLKIIKNSKNLGFAGGVNSGIKYCFKNESEYIVLLNNDAWVEKNWVETLVNKLEDNKNLAVVGGKLLKADGKTIDSTCDQYSSWGLPIARQRNKPANQAVSKDELVFGATAGACIYRATALKEVGLFDEKFFAYYEDTELNFRLQHAGWKILYTPEATGYHKIGGTSDKLKGFTTYQTIKNLPILFWKNVPLRLMPKMLPRFSVVYLGLFVRAILKGHVYLAFKGLGLFLFYLPIISVQRYKIQSNCKVSSQYIWSIIYRDLPPDTYKLRRMRSFLSFGKY